MPSNGSLTEASERCSCTYLPQNARTAPGPRRSPIPWSLAFSAPSAARRFLTSSAWLRFRVDSRSLSIYASPEQILPSRRYRIPSSVQGPRGFTVRGLSPLALSQVSPAALPLNPSQTASMLS